MVGVFLPTLHASRKSKRGEPIENRDEPLPVLPVVDKLVLEIAEANCRVFLLTGGMDGKKKLPKDGAAEAFGTKGAEVTVPELRGCLDAGLVGLR